ncbi:hypothetical protein [Methylocaldum sp.]|uniref:hypothetical protein n=1 Tax=Methylocaldum sp. TaxID=1969727 RepID=UPI002D2F2BBB|nr:hypothetical protein [Methylocaldum sp.]HYE37577.1 hypothetical protein [Methylocaldum sp.]
MPVQPADFLESAKLELKSEKEIHFRNAISRAYYAAYHSCLPLDDILPDHGEARTNVGVHERFISKLTKFPTSCDELARNAGMKIKSLGYVLQQCKTARHKADYDLRAEIGSSEAEGQISTAEKIFDKLSELKSILSSTASVDSNMISKL